LSTHWQTAPPPPLQALKQQSELRPQVPPMPVQAAQIPPPSVKAPRLQVSLVQQSDVAPHPASAGSQEPPSVLTSPRHSLLTQTKGLQQSAVVAQTPPSTGLHAQTEALHP
jgi:hypothetical protein